MFEVDLCLDGRSGLSVDFVGVVFLWCLVFVFSEVCYEYDLVW